MQDPCQGSLPRSTLSVTQLGSNFGQGFILQVRAPITIQARDSLGSSPKANAGRRATWSLKVAPT